MANYDECFGEGPNVSQLKAELCLIISQPSGGIKSP